MDADKKSAEAEKEKKAEAKRVKSELEAARIEQEKKAAEKVKGEGCLFFRLFLRFSRFSEQHVM